MFHHTKAQRSLTASRSLVFVSLMALAVALLVGIRPALATQPDASGEHKVTICHRTNSVTNPYVVITVDYSAADGSLVHDNGNGDHTIHLGPVFDWENPPPPPHNGDQWGDIIPPFSWPGDANHAGGSYPGMNWTDEGQAIYNEGDCDGAATATPTPTPSETETETPTPTPSETETPVATPTPTPEGSQAGSTGTPKASATPEGSVAAATGTPRPLPNTATDPTSPNALIVLGFGLLLLGSIGTLSYASVAARRRND